MNIGLIIDHPKRDLDGIVKIGNSFINNNKNNVFFIPLYSQAIDIPYLNLDVLIINYLRPINYELIKQYKSMGIKIFILDTEGGILSNSGANSIKGLINYYHKIKINNLIDGYFCWGLKVFNSFKEFNIIDTKKLHLTGNPRFDFTCSKYKKFLNFKYTDYILINTNFSLINSKFSKNLKNELSNFERSGWKKKYIDKTVKEQQKIFDSFMKIIFTISKKFPNEKFLLRPHPFEKEEIYKEKFFDLTNITVDGSGNVLNVINNAKCLLHLNCGTSIESIMLKKVPFSLEFINSKHMHNHSPLPSKISYRLHSIDRLFYVIKNLNNITKSYKFDYIYSNYIKDYFYLNDGKSSDRINIIISKSNERFIAPTFNVIFYNLFKSIFISNKILSIFQAFFANLTGSKNYLTIREFINKNRIEKRFIPTEILKCLEFYEMNSHKYTINYVTHPITRFKLSSIKLSRRK